MSVPSEATPAEYPDGLNREQWLGTVEARRNPFYAYPANLDQRIWRYMDFAKFVSMLQSGGVFFPAATLLGDAFEGSVSKENLRRRPQVILETVNNLRTGFAYLPFTSTDEDQIRSSMERFDAAQSLHLEWQRQWTYISCWHMNDNESAAMWRLYAASNQAIAIRSTFRKLHDCLRPHVQPPHGEPKLGMVRYADYDIDVVPRNVHLAEYFYKRKSFAHEMEVRAVMQDLPLVPASSGNSATGLAYDTARLPLEGRLLLVDLDSLIEEIYVAPGAPAWLGEVIRGVVERYRLCKPVLDSVLNARPVY